MPRHFLYLTNSRLVSMVTRGKRISVRREFAVTSAGVVAFEHHLQEVARVPAHLLTDLAEEDFRLDTIPHLGARDRDAVIARKLQQIFRNTPYRHAVVQGREADGRRDDRVLYTAVTNPEVLRPWLDAIERVQAPLAGIHSAAVFSSVMLEELDLLFPHTLLVTFTPGGAMRQTYFRDREIKFSRLTPIDPEEGQSLGTLISEETTRTWQYLDSLRHFAEDDRLEVCVLLHASDRAVVQPALRDFAQIQHRILDMDQVAAKLGLRPPPLSSTAEEVFVHLFLLRRAPNHFASPEMRRHDTLRRARIAIDRVAIAALAASLAWSGWNLTRVKEASDASERVAQQVSTLNHEYDQITRALPSFGVGGSTMRDAVAFYNGSIRGLPTVNDFVVTLSGVLSGHSDVRLAQLAWLATDDPDATPVLPPRPGETGAVKAVATTNEPASPRANPAPPGFSGGRYEVALLDGSVKAANNDFRGALDAVERLAEDVGRVPGWRASVVHSPLDTRPTVAILGRHTEHEPATMEPRFVLRIVHDTRPGPS